MKKVNALGFTLIELLIALVLGIIVVSGLISIYVSVVVSSGNTLKMTKLQQQTSAVINIMANDIRRAGYWGQGIVPDAQYILRKPIDNPFNTVGPLVSSTVLTLYNGNAAIAPSAATLGDCIVYTYDTADPAVPADPDNGILNIADMVGFKLNGATIQMKLSGAADKGNGCADSDGDWQDLTDNSVIEVNTLTFSLVNSVCINTSEPDGIGADDATELDCYAIAPTADNITTETLQVNISMTATLVSDENVSIKMDQIVRVRNDRVLTW